MDLGPLRALALELNVSAHGVPLTITRPAPDDDPIETRGIWVTPITEDFPAGTDMSRREPRRALAVSRTVVSGVPLGTRILAPEKSGDDVQRWRVVGTDRLEADHMRVLVIPDPML